MPRMRTKLIAASVFAAAGVLATLMLSGVTDPRPGVPSEESAPGRGSGAPTFSENIAPIVFENCAVCHRPGGSGPFSLLSYRDVRKRRRQILEVTGSRFMPPWKPERGEYRFVGERGLSPAQIRTLQDWASAGAPEGDPARLPEVPVFPEGWSLGEPDLVVAPEAPYALAAEGPDVFRNLVIPVPLERPRWVRAVELQPGNPRVVHHALLRLDDTGASRQRDGRDRQPGYGGMIHTTAVPPDGHIIGWTPGRYADSGEEGVAWRLEPGTDIVLETHLLPSGKPERVRPRIGLYFADRPPVKQPLVLVLSSEDIDIAAGDRHYSVEDGFSLPVDVRVLSVYPHAHYLGKEIGVRANLPDGTGKWLIRIRDWDFNWQDQYRYEQPVELPRGTRLHARWVYDNSSGNPRNPYDPPQRVVLGGGTRDEMAQVYLQVLARSPEEAGILYESYLVDRREKFPSWTATYNLAQLYIARRQWSRAAEYLERVVDFNGRIPWARCDLAEVLEQLGRTQEAADQYRAALAIAPDFSRGHRRLGRLLLRLGDAEGAEPHLRRAIAIRGDLADVHTDLGLLLIARGELEEALDSYLRAAELRPRDPAVLVQLAFSLHRLDRDQEAVARLRRALELDPNHVDAHRAMGAVLQQLGEEEAAETHYRRARELGREREREPEEDVG